MIERHEGPTPEGGDYSEACYLDENSQPCDKEKAVTIIIRECKADGTLIHETFMGKPYKTVMLRSKK